MTNITKMPEDGMKIMPDEVLRKINAAGLTKQVGTSENYDRKDLIDNCLRLMSDSIRVYDGKFNWNDIMFMINALKWIAYENHWIIFSATFFTDKLLEFDSYDDLVGEVEPTEETINLIGKIKGGTSKINIYALYYLMWSTLCGTGGSIVGWEPLVEKYLELSK